MEKGVKPIHVLGFQSEDVVFYEKQFQELGETYIVTVDGSHGSYWIRNKCVRNIRR